LESKICIYMMLMQSRNQANKKNPHLKKASFKANKKIPIFSPAPMPEPVDEKFENAISAAVENTANAVSDAKPAPIEKLKELAQQGKHSGLLGPVV
jgi:hypothetical protein